LSSERLQRYEEIADGDAEHALRLYVWNTALSESLYSPIQGLEVTLRNKIHDRLTSQFGASWYDDTRVGLQYVQRDQVSSAQRSLQDRGKPLDSPRLIAELNFGFWVGLFGPRYETHLWRPYLRHLFVNAPRPFLRKDVHRVLNDIRLLRNRVAHHEPILQRPLSKEHGLVLTAIGWLCTPTTFWVAHHSRFDVVHSARPWPVGRDVNLEDGPEVVARVVDGLLSQTTICA
jgi:hypothetical protein